MKTKERRTLDTRQPAYARPPPLGADGSRPLPSRTVERGPRGVTLAPIAAVLQTSFREQHRESEKLGLIEMLLGAERYRSILEIGCGTGELADRLVARCERYTGMDEETARLAAAARAVRAARFVPFELRADEPFALPSGEHELVVLSDVLHRLDPAGLGPLAKALDAHAACREIVAVSSLGTAEEASARYTARDEVSEADAERRLEALAAGLASLEWHVLALRARYRIDAFLPSEEALSSGARRAGEEREPERMPDETDE